LNTGTVAVFLNDAQGLASFPFAKQVHLYEKRPGGWVSVQIHYVDFSRARDIPALREVVRGLADRLGGCRIAAGRGMSGILYRELDRCGFSIFEIEELSPGVLDGISRDMSEPDAAADDPSGPVETAEPGVYTFDLVRYQNEYPDKSSKQALRPFLENTPFYELRLICSHVPPWIEKDYQTEAQTAEDGRASVIVRKRQCN
jgi:hypothetical protein